MKRNKNTKTPRKKTYIINKICRFCFDRKLKISYKDIKTLQGLISDRGKIMPRRISGNCASHQRELTTAVKRARNVALLPFSVG